MRAIIVKQCGKYNYFINDYAMLNLILDLIISIDRINKNCVLKSKVINSRNYGVRERQLSTDISEEIEKHFNINFSDIELQQLTVLLMGHLMTIDFKTLNNENIENVVGKECTDIVKQLLSYLVENYYIDIENKDFIVKFTMHIYNLLLRLKDNCSTKNPLTEHIKYSCPLVFDCAVGVANCIREITGYRLDEDEIAYIAIHIGGNLENYELNRNKISCILLLPQYYDFKDKIIDTLSKQFFKSILIKKIITDYRELEDNKSEDLLISTMKIDTSINCEYLFINPFLGERDIREINDRIYKIKIMKKKNRLKKLLIKFSSEELFYINKEFTNRDESIKYMIDIMKKKSYVNDNFINEVLERDNNISTAFENIAVPHSFTMNSPKTGMFILLSEKPIKWGENMVNIIILFAINREDRLAFHDVFDNLVVLLLEKINSNKVLKCSSYEEFVDIIIDCVE